MAVPVALDDTRRSALLGLKLRTLVREHVGREPDAIAGTFPPGAALRHGDEAWVLLADDPTRHLGHAIAWAIRHGARALDVVADSDAGAVARRAALFAYPISVWHADGRRLVPAAVETLVPPPPVRAEHLALRPLIEAGGADPVVEHGVLFGEVRGLEVCRVVDDPHLGVVRLEVGVGAHDREAFQSIHGDVPPAEALAGVVRAVTTYRDDGVPHHPLNRLARERLLRWQLEQDPAAVGAIALAPAEPPVARRNVKDPVPCVAVGTSASGRPLIVVCSTGVDLDVVPYAADARLAAGMADGPGVGWGEERELLIAVPARDRLPLTVEIAALLAQPAALVSVG